jgi:hypothetical protein
MATSWQPTTIVQCIRVKPRLTYPGGDQPEGFHDLTLGKVYELIQVEARGAFLRLIDDSGGDYLYPASHFRTI